MSYNKVILVGRVGKEPEFKSFTNGEIAKFSIATTERYTKDGKKVENTDWHDISVKMPSLVTLTKSYIHKGTQLLIDGKLVNRKYTGKDGAEKQIREIVASAITLLGSKADKPESKPEVNKTLYGDDIDEPW